MQVGVPRERAPGERRVALAPHILQGLEKRGYTVLIEEGAGQAAGYPDSVYSELGAGVGTREAAWACPIVVKIDPPTLEEAALLRDGAILVSLVDPARNGELLGYLAAKKVTAIALDRVPRITRAQKMDVLSSMANLAGYRAVIEAAHHFGSFFTGQMTAAGKSPPARVLVIGAGVAGLAAIGAARSLGAEVRAFDVRPACREQVESMGAQFLEVELPASESAETAGGYAKTMSKEFIEAEMALFARHSAEVDIIITTALIPGRPAPRLITRSMVAAMKRGSVVVDLAAPAGGNCEGTVPGQVVDVDGVTIIGYTDLTSRMAPVASRFFGTNIHHLLDELGGPTGVNECMDRTGRPVDLENEVFHQSAVVLQGEIRWPIPEFPKAAVPAPAPPKPVARPEGKLVARRESAVNPAVVTGVAAALIIGLGIVAPPSFLQHLTVFVLACFVGWQVVWNVTPALHTPLMSVTNAISGIIVVGGMLQVGRRTEGLELPGVLGAVAILVASINIAGGFLVTQRMLRMFKK